MAHEVETMFKARTPAWHGLGTVVEDALTAEAAIREAGLDWTVDVKPLKYETKTKEGNTSHRRVRGQYAIVREEDDAVLGTCSERWNPVQNAESFAFLDRLVDADGLAYESAGSLRGGRIVWLTARVPEDVVLANDTETRLYLLLENHHTAAGAVTVAATPVVVECMNTLNLALRAARRKWSAWHVGEGLDGRVAEAREALDLTYRYADGLKALSEELARIKVTDGKAEETFRSLLPDRPRREKSVEQMMATYRESPFNSNRGTGFGVVNAVGEYFEWTKGVRTEEARVMATFHGWALRKRDEAVERVKALA